MNLFEEVPGLKNMQIASLGQESKEKAYELIKENFEFVEGTTTYYCKKEDRWYVIIPEYI